MRAIIAASVVILSLCTYGYGQRGGGNFMPPGPGGGFPGRGPIPPVEKYFNEGNSLAEQRKYKEAVESFQNALNHVQGLENSKISDIYNNMAYAYLGAGMKAEAKGAAEKAVSLATTAMTLDTLGDVYQAIGDKQASCRAFDRACNAGGSESCRKKSAC
jgi:tetratricopeptide (TPR) repeat protein